MDKPILCPVLVGRTQQLESLERLLGLARGGLGQAVLVSGEAGIGKSRLVAEARARAERLGFVRLEGHCFEPDRALPYAPLLDLLRGRLVGQSPEAIARALGAAAPEVGKLLPELASLLPGLEPPPALEPEQEKRRLFQALLQVLTNWAAAQPLLVIVEDLHWADETSLDFLLHLARRVSAQALLLLLTYRTDEPQPGLAHLLAEFDRERLATELSLVPLARVEVDAMLRATLDLDRPVRHEFLDALHQLTEGNPFFIEEVLKSLVAAGDIFYGERGWDRKPLGELRIPRSVQDAVRRRAARLSEAAQEVLRLAAVAGRRFDFALLQALTQQDEQELLESVKELIGAQLVVEASADQFAFRHALTRQALYTGLLARERQALHRRIAEALERQHAGAPDEHSADLAYHFLEAGHWAKALEYGRWAGERAQALYAPREAVEQFTRALEAAARLGTPPAKLYRARGQAYETLGVFERAQADYEAALALARALGDRQAEWQALLDLGFLWASRDYARTGENYQWALELARTMDDPAALAHSLNRLGNWYLNVEQPRIGQRHHEEALAIFEGLADRHGVSQTLDLLGLARMSSGDLQDSIASYERAARLFRELGDRSGLVMSLAVLTSRAGDGHFDPLAAEPAEFARAVAAGEEALAAAREIEWRSAEAFACAQLGQCLGTRGEYARALAMAHDACRIADEIEHRQWQAFANEVLGRLYLDLLALPTARRHLERALTLARETNALIWRHASSGGLISACVQQGELGRAEAVLAELPGLAEFPQTFAQRLVACACVELALARGEPDRALHVVDQMRGALEPADRGDHPVVGPPHLARLRGEALAALGRVVEAEAGLRAAQEAAAARAARPQLWRIHIALGKLYQAQARPDEAERAFAAAQATIAGLAASVPDQPVPGMGSRSLRDHFLRSATASLPGSRRFTRVPVARSLPGGLTPREVEVLRLLAAGRSNREIAAELVVSVRTVEHHIASIYAKIAARRRADATTYALRQGLLPVDEAGG